MRRRQELIELCKVAAKYQGKYISHMRSEGNQLLEAVDELIRISREANIPAEIYHIKAAGKSNWPKLDELLAKIEAAQKEGLKITADMYTYTAGGTGLDACLPPWTEEGGYPALFKRLRDPATREKIAAGSENAERCMGESLSRRRFAGADHSARRVQVGKTEAADRQIARRGREDARQGSDRNHHGSARGRRVADRLDLFRDVGGKRAARRSAKPWISFGSDEASQAPEGVFLKSNPHPRAYGNFARVLGKYSREALGQALAQGVRAEHVHAGGGQLQREGEAIEAGGRSRRCRRRSGRRGQSADRPGRPA